MPPSPLAIADHDLRAAKAAHAEHHRLRRTLEALTPDLVETKRDVEEREQALAAEQRDVRRYEGGLWAFLYDLVADGDARLTQEQREAAVAELRLAEAVTVRDRLAEEVASLSAQLDALGDVDARLAATRTDKAVALLAAGGTDAAQLAAVNAELDKLEPMRRELEQAVVAGQRSHGALTQLAQVLASARSWGQADLLTDNILISWAKRDKLDDARRFAGIAQAELMVFARELGDVGMSLHAEVTHLADRSRFLDTWFDNILTDWNVQGVIRQAQASTEAALAAVASRTDELQRTLAGVALHIGELGERRLAVLG